jgi:creatinine amidohydrolase/Fe(II)-dependent formamide hydrolase-like protein
MNRPVSWLVLACLAGAPSACSSASSSRSTAPSPVVQAGRVDEPLVEFEMMTWPEVKAALAAGKTTALFYTGGTEQRGPQNVNGGHTLMGRATVKAIAQRLGNAIAMPVLPYTPNRASAALPGTIGLTDTLLSAILERVTEEAIATGFKNVVLMGDHGGGQPNAYRSVAARLEAKHAKDGVHVFFCDSVYSRANADFDKWLTDHGYPTSSHAGIPDTSEMLYLGGESWVRTALIPTAVGDTLPRGAARDPNAPRVNNGITGDARRSTAELGKMIFDMKIDYAVKQIQGFIANTR